MFTKKISIYALNTKNLSMGLKMPFPCILVFCSKTRCNIKNNGFIFIGLLHFWLFVLSFMFRLTLVLQCSTMFYILLLFNRRLTSIFLLCVYYEFAMLCHSFFIMFFNCIIAPGKPLNL